MVDNVAITAGSGTTIAADDIGGGVLAQRIKPVWGPDGTGNDTDVASGKAFPIQIRSATGLIPIGEPTDAKSSATDATSTSMISLLKQISSNLQAGISGIGASVEVIPTVTAGSYTAGFVVGGIMTFASILPANFTASIQSLSLKFKGTVQVTEFDVSLFTASPAGTFADHGAPAIATADTALLIGTYPMIANFSNLGTHTVYSLDGIAKQIVGASTSLFAVVTTKSIPVAPASTTEMSLRIGTLF